MILFIFYLLLNSFHLLCLYQLQKEVFIFSILLWFLLFGSLFWFISFIWFDLFIFILLFCAYANPLIFGGYSINQILFVSFGFIVIAQVFFWDFFSILVGSWIWLKRCYNVHVCYVAHESWPSHCLWPCCLCVFGHFQMLSGLQSNMKEQINNDQEKLKQELQQLQDTVKQHQDDIQKLVTNNYTYFIHCYILLNPHSLGKITAPVFVTKY